MRMKMLGTLVFAVSVLVAGVSVAQQSVKVGTLTCSGGAGVGLVLGSSKSYDCNFAPTNGGAAENYTATVSRIGLDIGVTGNANIVWVVFAPSQESQPRALVGDYVGASADASLGLGGGAKVLVGGSTQSITLQPLSVQGQTGVNLAVGIAGMTLR